MTLQDASDEHRARQMPTLDAKRDKLSLTSQPHWSSALLPIAGLDGKSDAALVVPNCITTKPSAEHGK